MKAAPGPPPPPPGGGAPPPAAAAVDRLAELHRQATAALSQALKRYIK
ncbi:hypothetical protein QCC43_29380, partial [Pseudomonas aeruginosa]